MSAERLDAALVNRGHVRSRSRARRLVLDGQVRVDGAVVTKPAARVAPAQRIVIDPALTHWVGRGAQKLGGAIDAVGLRVAGRVALDIGASTGGFTQVLLERGVAEVFAVDVGHGQLAAELVDHPRVYNIERTNARNLQPTLLPRPPSVVVADVSFISLTLLLPPITRVSAEDADALLLVKPQFEVGPELLDGQGVVRSATARARAVGAVLQAAQAAGWKALGVVPSPIVGGQGNREYFAHLTLREDAVARGLSELTALVSEDEPTGPDVEGALQ